jgi:hypothetical protein
MREERLYFFQFPSPFPTFAAPAAAIPDSVPEVVAESSTKKVSFADDVKAGSLPGSARGSMAPPEPPAAVKPDENPLIDGIIGTLEVYRSGAVKMRLHNGILLDVTSFKLFLYAPPSDAINQGNGGDATLVPSTCCQPRSCGEAPHNTGRSEQAICGFS